MEIDDLNHHHYHHEDDFDVPDIPDDVLEEGEGDIKARYNPRIQHIHSTLEHYEQVRRSMMHWIDGLIAYDDGAFVSHIRLGILKGSEHSTKQWRLLMLQGSRSKSRRCDAP